MQNPDTLEFLRDEYQSFKDNAASRVKITKRMLAKATAPHISKIKSVQLRIYACGLIAIVIWPWLCHQLDLSLAFEIATLTLVGCSVAFQWWNLKNITDPTSDRLSLLQLAEQSLTAKRRLLREFYVVSAEIL